MDEEISDLFNKMNVSSTNSKEDHCTTPNTTNVEDKNLILNLSNNLNFLKECEIENKAMSREEICKNMEKLNKFEEIVRIKNNWLHEYLVNYFKKKHLMHVFTDKIDEENERLDDYIQKQIQFERILNKIRQVDDKWKVSLLEIKEEITQKQAEATIKVENMIQREREIGLNTWDNGKLMSPKKVQGLITKQIDKMRSLSQSRLQYMNLCNKLMLIKEKSNSIESCNLNLTKGDYERLEAENFYYRQELLIKEKKHKELSQNISSLKKDISMTKSKINKKMKEINVTKEINSNLTKELKNCLRERRVAKNKLFMRRHLVNFLKKNYIDSKSGILNTKMMDMEKEHEDGIQKINTELIELKALRDSTSAIKRNFVLHGKNMELNLRPIMK